MQRIVRFQDGDTRNQRRFELLYGAVLIGGSQPGATRGIEILRRESKLLDALDGVSVEDPQGEPIANDTPARTVTAGASFTIDQPAFELLKKRVEDTPWLPKAAREVVDVVDWLSTAPAEDR